MLPGKLGRCVSKGPEVLWEAEEGTNTWLPVPVLLIALAPLLHGHVTLGK
jgi:hypothetical protein